MQVDEAPSQLPLHPFQESILLDQANDFVDARYNVGGYFELSLGVDVGRLKTAVIECYNRNEALRTRLVIAADRPYLFIAPDAPPVEIMAIDEVSGSSGMRSAKNFMKNRMESAFDLRNEGPLAEFVILQPVEGRVLLFFRAHHLIIDAAGFQALVRDLAKCYSWSAAALREDAAPGYLAEIAEGRAYLESAQYQADTAHWRHWIEDNGARLDPAFPGARGERLARGHTTMDIDPKTAESISVLAAEAGVSVIHLSLAALSLCLARLNDRHSFIAGMLAHGRITARKRRLVGLLANVIPTMVRYQPAATVRQLLEAVRNGAIRDLRARRYPINHLQRLFREATGRDGKLYDVVVNYQPFDISLHIEGDVVPCHELSSEQEVFPLHFVWRGDGAGGPRVLTVEYCSSAFSADAVARLRDCFLHTIDQFAAGLSRPLSAIEIIGTEQRRRLLGFAGAAETRPDDALVHQAFEERARLQPTAEALVYRERSVTYGELNSRSNQLAHHLIAIGVKPDDRVAICLERSPDMLAALLGVLKAGAAYVPMDPGYPADRLVYVLADCRPKIVLTMTDLGGRFSDSTAPVLRLDAEVAHLADLPEDDPHPADLGVGGSNLAYLIYTSGSTGRPKGVAMTHRGVMPLLTWHRDRFVGGAQDRTLQFAAFGFDVAFQEIFATLSKGGTLVIPTEAVRRDPQRLLDLMGAQNVTRAFLPPSALAAVARAAERTDRSLPALRDLIVAGEQLKVDQAVRSFAGKPRPKRLHNHYGPTETHVATAMTLEGGPERWPERPFIGRPVAGARIYVLDPEMQLTPPGAPGEIHIGGAPVARGYFGRPALTAERFLADPYGSESGARMYRTGDLGRWSAEGQLEFLGRNDRQSKIRGFRVEMGEIEARLGEVPGVRDAVVMAREDEAGDARLVAYVRVVPGIEIGAAELRATLGAKLPEYMIPSAYVQIDEWPVNPNGKLDRAALPAPRRSATAVRQYEPPEGELETEISAIWCDLLQLDRVGRHDDFFDLGGHSLHAMQVANRLADTYDVDVSLSRFAERPTIAALAELVINDALAQFDPAEVQRVSEEVERLSAAEVESSMRVEKAPSQDSEVS